MKICEYLVTTGIVANLGVDPNDYNIESVETQEWQGRNVIWVRLDCCFTGDIAFIDPDTDEVIGFDPGDV